MRRCNASRIIAVIVGLRNHVHRPSARRFDHRQRVLPGLSLALRLHPDLKVAVISKRQLEEGSTFYAQGGISAVLDEEDTLSSHVEDTLNAGAGLCEEKTVQLVVEQGPENIRWLMENGAKFTRDDNSASSGGYHLTREGGHSHRRVIHAADATGREVETTLEAQVMARANVELFEYHIAIDLITNRKRRQSGVNRCVGAYILNQKQGRVKTFRARFVVIASGGASKVYLYTSNPDVSTGDGIAMAWQRWLSGRQHGVHPVSPHLPLPSRGT